MRAIKPGQSEQLVRAFISLYKGAPPLTPEEIAEKESAIAKVKAEDERKREAERDLFDAEEVSAE